MTIKTAIAVDETLFERVAALSHLLAISPSRLFVLTVQEFIAKYENLPKASVVNVTQIFTVDKRDLDELIGTLSPRRVR